MGSERYFILFLNRGATAIMNTEIWKRFLIARDEIFKTDEKIFISAVTVRELIHEDNTPLTFYSELEKSITKETVVQKQTVTKQKKHRMQKKLQKRKFKVPYARKNGDTSPKRLIFHQRRWQIPWNRKTLYRESQLRFQMKKSFLLIV